MAENSDVRGTVPSCKRTEYISWEEYFMGIAVLASKRSKDPVTQVGACIVNDKKLIVSAGYNGMPWGCHDDQFAWNKQAQNPLDYKGLYVCHAELNAVLNKNSSSVEDCTIYVTLFPCNECAKIIIQSGIKHVVYLSDKNAEEQTTLAAKRLLDTVGVKYRKYIPKNDTITIYFTDFK